MLYISVLSIGSSEENKQLMAHKIGQIIREKLNTTTNEQDSLLYHLLELSIINM